jgi:hypothetical protein
VATVEAAGQFSCPSSTTTVAIVVEAVAAVAAGHLEDGRTVQYDVVRKQRVTCCSESR